MSTAIADIGCCHECGHFASWHRFGDGFCTHELYDDELDIFIACGCQGWR